MHLALLHARIRVEERLLIEEIQRRGIGLDILDARDLILDPDAGARFDHVDLLVDRSLSLTQSLTIGRTLQTLGVRVVNTPDAVEVAGDKLRTSLALTAAGVPQCRCRVAVSPEAALLACEQLGYPVVLKPTVGSWGRLVARANDRDAAEAIIEHRETLGGPQHGVFYIQEHIDKARVGGRDIRAFVVDGRVIAAIVRTSDHWITNTARGGRATNYPVSDELDELCSRAVAAVGADIAAVDVFETAEPGRSLPGHGGGLIVNEVNHSMEFRNSIEPTGVDIPARVADALERLATEPVPVRAGERIDAIETQP